MKNKLVLEQFVLQPNNGGKKKKQKKVRAITDYDGVDLENQIYFIHP